jgi:20S proteasome alpha/beta subunit
MGGPPPVHVAAATFEKLCYENKDALSAGIIVAGWDEGAGPSVYNIPLGGGLFKQPWAIGGTFDFTLRDVDQMADQCLQPDVQDLALRTFMVTVTRHTRRDGEGRRRSSSCKTVSSPLVKLIACG